MEHSGRRLLPVQFKPLEEDRARAIKEDFPSYIDGLVRGTPGGFVLTPDYAASAEDIYNFQVRPDDCWVLSFPKSGTTWMQELVWLLRNDCNFEEAKKVNLVRRTCDLEWRLLQPRDYKERFTTEDGGVSGVSNGAGEVPRYGAANTLAQIDEFPSPRIIKSHLPLYLLPPDLLEKSKAVYVARNPKDVIVSGFFYHKLLKVAKFEKGLEEAVDYHMRDEIIYNPYFSHVLEAWNQRHHPNLLFVFYEDMKSDLAGQIRKVAEFLGKPVTEETIEKMVDHLKIDNFATNASVNREHIKKLGLTSHDGNFIRKGKTGDWKNHFSPELNAKIDQWIEKNLAGTDLKFVMELEHQD